MTRFLCLAIIVLTFGSAIGAAKAQDMTGTWLTAQGDAHIRLTKCNKGICATIAWLKNPIDAKTRQPPVDDKNPDPGKRSRKLLGLRIFTMEQDATGSWVGPIYNAEDGMTYRGRLSPRGDNELEVQGCAESLCGSEVWTRVKN
jgi:uncharacterized protein (DUF2147 family)